MPIQRLRPLPDIDHPDAAPEQDPDRSVEQHPAIGALEPQPGRTGGSAALAHGVALPFDGADDALAAFSLKITVRHCTSPDSDVVATENKGAALADADLPVTLRSSKAAPGRESSSIQNYNPAGISDGIPIITGNQPLFLRQPGVSQKNPQPFSVSSSTKRISNINAASASQAILSRGHGRLACDIPDAGTRAEFPHDERRPQPTADARGHAATHRGARQTVACQECSGRGWLLVEGRLRIDCDHCYGDGTARCVECREPATVLHHVNCRPALAMPLCAKHHAEYLEDAA